MFQYIFLLFVLVQIVLSDDIYIYGPPQNGIYHPKDVMDIRYAVHSMGMTRIWSASAKLTNVETNTTIEGFPLTNWTASNNTQNFSHDIWTIPVDMPNGNYSMCVSGNTTFMCSKNGNGTAPFEQCHSNIYKYTTFIINNGTLEEQNK